MYWLSRPPYLRWAAATVVVIVSLAADLRPPSTIDHPFLVADLPAGSTVSYEYIEMRPVPVGLFEPVDLPARMSRAGRRGEPVLIGGLADATSEVPDGWWVVPIETTVTPPEAGAQVRVVVSSSDGGSASVVPGVMAPGPSEGAYGNPVAMVAVPPESAAEVAAGAGEGRVTVLVVAGR